MPDLDNQKLEQGLKEIVAKIVEIEPEKVTPDADFVKDLGMDSMMALEILSAIEKKYKIQVPEEKLNQIRSLKQVTRLTNEYLNK